MIEKVSGEEIKNEELDNELEQEGTPRNRPKITTV